MWLSRQAHAAWTQKAIHSMLLMHACRKVLGLFVLVQTRVCSSHTAWSLEHDPCPSAGNMIQLVPGFGV